MTAARALTDRPEHDTFRTDGDALIVDLDGFEGPIDLLLTLAREQKVDLTRISVLRLAEQYLAFMRRVRGLRFEVAADYLVMAAWLAYLKSRLLLPQENPQDGEGASAEALAGALAHRLKRLEAMRGAAAALMDRNRLGRDVFARGMPEPPASMRRPRPDATLYDLLQAYAAQRQAQFVRLVRVRKRDVITLKEARERLVRLLGHGFDWVPIDTYLADYLARPEMRATARASALSASLELVREGAVELRQTAAFAPLYMRRKPAAAQPQECRRA